MKVRELMKKLSGLDPELEVFRSQQKVADIHVLKGYRRPGFFGPTFTPSDEPDANDLGVLFSVPCETPDGKPSFEID